MRKEALSTAQAARLLGVAVQSVINWINQGQLKAYRTPGGHRRIEPASLVTFLQEHGMPVPAELAPAPAKVLVVDDEKAVAKLIGKAIQRRWPEVEVFHAHDGFAAGEMIAAIQPAVVLLDLRMPGLDGFEVCRRIKARPETRDTVVIAMTAYHSADAEKQIRACGAVACLSKPFDTARLFEQLERVLG
jgi:excisionase family DNA binding protein